jgi:hypothetical protein
LFDEVLQYEQRRKWDKTLASCRVLKMFSLPIVTAAGDWGHERHGWVVGRDVGVTIKRYTTHAAVGGAISGRVFTDAYFDLEATAVHPSGGSVPVLLSATVAYKGEEPWAALEGDERLLERGCNFGGSGLLVTVAPEETLLPDRTHTTFLLVTLGHTDIGGWIPRSVVNGATGKAYADILRGVAEALLSKAPGVTARAPF